MIDREEYDNEIGKSERVGSYWQWDTITSRTHGA